MLRDDLAEMLRRTSAAFAAPRRPRPDPRPDGRDRRPTRPCTPPCWNGSAARGRGSTTGSRVAVERGEVRDGVDTDVLIETLAGAALMRLLVSSTDGLDEDWIDRTTDLLMRGIAS